MKQRLVHARQNVHTRTFMPRAHIAAHDITQNCTKIVLIVHYYVMALSLKFLEDLSFYCGDICKITLNTHARGIIEHAKCQHLHLHVFVLCAPVCAQIFTKNFLVVHHSVIILNFKFHKDPIFRCRFFFGHHCN